MTDYYGQPVGTLTSPFLRLEYLTQAGPRLVRLCLAGQTENLLAEAPGVGWETPHGWYSLYGGHRLWHAPETANRTSIPDGEGLTVEVIPGGVRLTQPREQPTDIGKAIEVTLDAGRPAVRLVHRLSNHGLWGVDLAPWAITLLPLGGQVVIPQVAAEPNPSGLLPDRHLVLWPYAQWNDARLKLGQKAVVVQATPNEQPFKLGSFVGAGWVAYVRPPVVFVKRFTPLMGARYPDRGSNVEVYSNHRFVEVETLGPLVRLEPGHSVEHVETWEVYATGDVPVEIAAVVGEG